MKKIPPIFKCPSCGKEFGEVSIVHGTDKPFTSKDRTEGMCAYGLYDSPRELLCWKDNVAHIKLFGQERLVQHIPEEKKDNDADKMIEELESVSEGR